MKNCYLQARFSPEERQMIIEKSKACGMNVSTYMRTVLLNAPVNENGAAQRAMTHICRAFTILNSIDSPEAGHMREELNEVCRALQS